MVMFPRLCGMRVVITNRGHPQGGKAGIFPPWKLGSEPKFSRGLDLRNVIPMSWFNSCIDSLFACMTLTPHKRQVHCVGVMHWWA